MSTVILALSSAARDGGAPAAAVERARELGAELLALYVVDSRTIEGLERRMTGDGFVGDRPCAMLMTAAVDEWRRAAEVSLNDVTTAAESAGVTCTTRVVEGSWVDRIAAAAKDCDAAACVAPKFLTSPLTRLLRTDDLARLRARLDCPVTSAP